LATVGDADRLANVIRQAIARFRVDNVSKLGLSASQGRMLSRLLIGPEFRNHQGGDGQTVSLLGALLVNRPVPAPEVDAIPASPLEAMLLTAEASPLEDPFPGDRAFPTAGGPPAAAAFPADSPLLADAGYPADADFRTGTADSPLLADAGYPADADFRTGTADSADSAFSADAPLLADAGYSGDPARSIHSGFQTDAPSSAEAGLSAAAPALREDRPFAEGTRLIAYRPGRAADAARALMAAKAEETTQQTEPATASRAAELAARIASLVSRSAEPAPVPAAEPTPIAQDQHSEPEVFHSQDSQQFQGRLEDRPTDDHRSFGSRLSEMRSVDAGRPEETGSPGHEAWSRGPWQTAPELGQTRRAVARHSEARHSEPRHSERSDPAQPDGASAERRAAERRGAERLAADRVAAERVAAERADTPTANLAKRADSMRRTAARMAANAARGRVSERRGDREPGISTRGNRNS
jgi:hypothetical protein